MQIGFGCALVCVNSLENPDCEDPISDEMAEINNVVNYRWKKGANQQCLQMKLKFVHFLKDFVRNQEVKK